MWPQIESSRTEIQMDQERQRKICASNIKLNGWPIPNSVAQMHCYAYKIYRHLMLHAQILLCRSRSYENIQVAR